MPFVRFQPAAFPSQSDPFVDFLAAALAADSTPSHCGPKAANRGPAQCQTRGSCGPRQNRVVKRIIAPNFDISETEDAYILEGELPGVSNKSSISVDFEDAQTIVVKGEVSRVRRAFNNKKAAEPEQLTEEALQASAAAQEKATTTVEGETVVYNDDAASTTSTKSKPKAVTVEDEVDESETASNASFEVVEGPTKADKGKASVKDTDVEMTEAAEKPAKHTCAQTCKKACAPSAKYWVSERSIGVFERKFKFEHLIDQDNVKASLENGLLTIVVPKREAFVRSIFIN